MFNIESMAKKLTNKMGIEINGNEPSDIKIHNDRVYKRVIKEQSIGLGESYMDKDWDCERLDLFFEKLYRNNLSKERYSLDHLLGRINQIAFNIQNIRGAKEVNETHYDLGNELYEKMLDSNLLYTCGYWDFADSLEEAQIHKMDTICRKLDFKPGMKILDIGCGFGSFLKYAAENYGVEGVGVTLSKEQQRLGLKRCKDLPVKIELMDYRHVTGEFDRIVSIGMFEAVGYKNFRVFMEKASSLLDNTGAMCLHTIGVNTTKFPVNHWVDKYIFPRGYLPSMQQLAKSAEDLFIIEDVQNFGNDYDKTLMAWHSNFIKSWDSLQKLNPQKYNERFKRMWEFYLLSFAGGFRARNFQLWQTLLTKPECELQNMHHARIMK